MSAADSDGAGTASRGPRRVQWHPAPEVAARAPAPDATIFPLPGVPTTGFNAHGGVVMYNPRVFAIYWGRDYGSFTTGTNALARQFDAFFASVLNSAYLDPLSQYNNVNRGTFLGSTWVDHDPTTAETFTSSQIASRLSAWIDAGLTFAGNMPVQPMPDEHDLLFVVFPPTEVMVADPTGATTGFCGFHSSDFYHKSNIFGQSNLFYAIITPPATTATVAHEIVEAFTDRDGNGWFSDATTPGPEIGDVCNACGAGTLTLGGFLVASYWLVDSNRCLQQSDLTPPPPSGQLLVTISPLQLPMGVPTTFTVLTVDSLTGQPVTTAQVTIHNYTNKGDDVIPVVTLTGSPATASGITFHLGKTIDPETHEATYDKVPTIEVDAPGFSSVVTSPEFNIP